MNRALDAAACTLAALLATLTGCAGDSALEAGDGAVPGAMDTGGDAGAEPEAPDPSEALPGGATTNTLLLGPNAFARPADNLDSDSERMFYTGNSLFNQSWVEAPASTEARDGLGPTFNARSCSGCHFKDGRGAPPGPDGDQLGLLLRLSVPGGGGDGAPLPVPGYGGQLEDHAIQDVAAEGRIEIEYDEVEGTYDDGEPYTLRAPTYRIADPAFGPLPDDLEISPRIAPQMIGMGLLEAIPEERLEALADPDDEDGDGISGRVNRVYDASAKALAPGRLGWKAEQPSVRQQAAGAFLGDMGITSSLFPEQECPAGQDACAAAASGGEPEISDALLDKVVVYASVLAVPIRQAYDDPAVLRGKGTFNTLGCAGCHTPSHETGEAKIEALSGQHIWPYTDLLLHDMGESLADHRPSFAASGSEWRTSPLWGLGHVEDVGGQVLLLHDGRARGFAEAILWHGGEAQASADGFRALPADERADLVRFLESL